LPSTRPGTDPVPSGIPGHQRHHRQPSRRERLVEARWWCACRVRPPGQSYEDPPPDRGGTRVGVPARRAERGPCR